MPPHDPIVTCPRAARERGDLLFPSSQPDCRVLTSVIVCATALQHLRFGHAGTRWRVCAPVCRFHTSPCPTTSTLVKMAAASWVRPIPLAVCVCLPTQQRPRCGGCTGVWLNAHARARRARRVALPETRGVARAKLDLARPCLACGPRVAAPIALFTTHTSRCILSRPAPPRRADEEVVSEPDSDMSEPAGGDDDDDDDVIGGSPRRHGAVGMGAGIASSALSTAGPTPPTPHRRRVSKEEGCPQRESGRRWEGRQRESRCGCCCCGKQAQSSGPATQDLRSRHQRRQGQSRSCRRAGGCRPWQSRRRSGWRGRPLVCIRSGAGDGRSRRGGRRRTGWPQGVDGGRSQSPAGVSAGRRCTPHFTWHHPSLPVVSLPVAQGVPAPDQPPLQRHQHLRQPARRGGQGDVAPPAGRLVGGGHHLRQAVWQVQSVSAGGGRRGREGGIPVTTWPCARWPVGTQVLARSEAVRRHHAGAAGRHAGRG